MEIDRQTSSNSARCGEGYVTDLRTSRKAEREKYRQICNRAGVHSRNNEDGNQTEKQGLIDIQTNEQANRYRQTIRQASKHIDSETDSHTDTEKLGDVQEDNQRDRQASR